MAVQDEPLGVLVVVLHELIDLAFEIGHRVERAVVGTSDYQVWTSTGCTCVLVTSTADAVG